MIFAVFDVRNKVESPLTPKLHYTNMLATCCQHAVKHVVDLVDMRQDGGRRGSANFDFGVFVHNIK